MQSGWNWEGFFEYLTNYYLFEGALVTLGLTVFAMSAGLVLGFIIAVMRMSKYKFLSGPAYFYIWIFRGTPLLVQLIIIYTGLPQLGIKFTVIQSTLLGLALCEAAYLSEIIRAGINAVPRGQVNAALAIGMRPTQVMRYIVAPQALRIIIPPLGNSVNGVLKTTSIASIISMEELLRRTQVLIQEKFLVLELFMVAALYYLAMTTAWELIQRRIEKRFGKAYGPMSSDAH
ncbi:MULTISPECIES: amino acid ABC transporter permease [Rhizobium/Agrobacterium group]|jgi:polar amino acid transport system permease protein|uniref:Glutamate/aspartate import permease protein GltK n=1 Tax=Agrobacterium pusense TaxID=648995 RepID=A0AA44EH23_9HYPH|nr:MULTISPECIES: amino acid ABC transporter permease [Agrobacterium]NRF07073.1 amino acid ABC transporter permease [Agrobacterium pusense]NRF17937.1 amino acid ABC transporter permease [Agrobacterium pusense]HBT68025.1 ABC transporter permease [Agrobacterium sp.]